MLWVILFLSLGYGAELLFSRIFIKKYFHFEAGVHGGLTVDTGGAALCNVGKFNAIFMKVLPDFIGIVIFAVVAFLSFTTFIYTPLPFLRLFFLATLMTITLIRLIILVSHIIFSPSIIQFRVLPLQCQVANSLHKFLVWPAAYIIIAMMFSIVTFKLGAQKETMLLLQLFFISLLLLGSIIMVLSYRKQVRLQLLLTEDGSPPTWGRQKVADMWHILTIGYLLTIWFLILNIDNTSNQNISQNAFLISFFIIPIWLVLNKLVQWMVELAVTTLKIYDDNPSTSLSEEEFAQNQQGKQFLKKCKSAARIILAVVLGGWLASLWGVSLPFLSRFTTVFFDAAIILTLALIFWQFTSSWIERKIQESIPEEEEDKTDDEWGAGAARGRSYTLLPMIRKFIGTILVIMVTMTVLSSMGVDIGPLLAGAGVVGLAVGFGAQKLVADMFSGFFFLLDDAFRVGEYLEAGTVSGMVEDITLRNVMLRHHRGMLQIVPHSELGPITNFMRGGIVVKFNLDFPYDANIDKIRKVIKKVGQAMLQDEEFGKDFIRPVKSQGVREITNSVMTIRVKFTAQPGTHFVIRREAFKRITEALKKQGIEYAHKKVIVDLPQDANSPATKEVQEAAGAAAMQAIEEDKQGAVKDGGKESFLNA